MSAFATVALSFLGFKYRHSDWLPNRHYISGMCRERTCLIISDILNFKFISIRIYNADNLCYNELLCISASADH